MEDADVRSGIPLGHKFFAVLLAAAVAGAGCAWLIYQSGRSASTAVLAFNPTAAQSVDPGIASSRNPAVALADALLSDQAVATLAKQAHLTSSTPAGQIGEFRSDLQLRQPSGLLDELPADFHLTRSSASRLDVSFEAADPSQSVAVANDVAHVLAAGGSASGATAAPPAQPQSAAVPGSSSQPPAPANQGQSTPPAAAAAASQATPPTPAPADHPLSEALDKLGAQLSATDGQVERLAASGAFDSESRQQSLLRAGVREARGTVAELHSRYAEELADPNIGARVSEIQQALDSILSGGRRNGFYAVGVSRRELSNERSELRQAISIVNDEAKRVRAAEAAHPAANAHPNAPATSPSPQTTAANPSPASASPSPAAAQSSSSGVQEQNIGSTPSGSQAAQQTSQSPLSIVRLAAPASRPPLWPAIVAGAVCGLFYLGIAAFAYRRRGSDDFSLGLSSAPQRMITPSDPVRVEESRAAPPEPARFEKEAAREADRAPRQRAAFVFQPPPPEQAAASPEKPAAPAENPPAPEIGIAAPAEDAAAPAQAANPALPAEVAAPVANEIAEPVASAVPAGESVAAPAETAAAPAAVSEPEHHLSVSSPESVTDVDPVAERIRKGIAETFIGPAAVSEPAQRPHAEPDTDVDPVAERLKKNLAETSIGRSLEGLDRPDRDAAPPDRSQQAENSDWLDEWFSPSGRSTSRQ